jgi:hypothetical protein
MITRNEEMMEVIPYNYKNVPIPGGGFVTGFVFHPTTKDILYARTDIGGCYRYDFNNRIWIPLVNKTTNLDLMETFPLSIALDKQNPEALYIACGDGNKGRLCISNDRGNTFTYYEIPYSIHGNNPGRGTGERLIIDDHNSKVIYFGSMKNGLVRSIDGGKTWSNLQVGINNEPEITFVYIDSRDFIEEPVKKSKTIIVGTTGEANQKSSVIRGYSLYMSNDGGEHFVPMSQPEPVISEKSCIAGFVGERCAFDGTYLYVTAVSTGTYASFGFSSYACDSNHPADGRLLRYKLDEDGLCGEFFDVTPRICTVVNSEDSNQRDEIKIGCGLGGVSIHKEVPGFVLCSTIARNTGDMIVISKDYGLTWDINLFGITKGNIEFTVPYMKPQYNGNTSLIHWLSDIKINPFNPNHAVFNTGTGVFMTYNLLEDDCKWTSLTYGIEETVHLNIYSPPKGDVKLLDILGDLGGFAFTNLDEPAENTFADNEGNRYITCCNGDYSDVDPNYVVATPRGNWTGKTTGGIIYSKDQCKNFELLSHPFGISEDIDKLLIDIRKPNVNSGWVAISPDCSTILWSIAKGYALPANCVVYSKDEGRSWNKSFIYDMNGKELNENEIIPAEPSGLRKGGWKAYKEHLGNMIGLKIFADRINSNVFYGFGDHSKLYVSLDGGITFRQRETPKGVPVLNLAGIDSNNLAEIRVESDKEGVIWIALGEGGLWKLTYNQLENKFSAQRISKDGDVVYCQGMGKGVSDSENKKALYICGTINGLYGFWRSIDEGCSWSRINDKNQMFGDIRSITGDPRVFGRVFIGTGTRGVLYGEPIKI